MLLANFNGKEHLRHRAVSLRQHGFLVKVWHCCVMNWWRYSSTSDVRYYVESSKIPDSATALLWLLSLRPLQRRLNRGQVDLFGEVPSVVCAPLFGHFKFYILTKHVLVFTHVAIKATVFLSIGICDHLALSFGRTQTSTVLLLTSVTKTELMLWISSQ